MCTTIQPAIKSKISRLRINGITFFIAAPNRYRIKFFGTFFRNIGSKCRIATLMAHNELTIYKHFCLLPRRRYLQKQTRILRRRLPLIQRFYIPVTASVICSISLLSIQCIPCVRQRNKFSISRSCLQNIHIRMNKPPIFIKI